MKKKTAGLVAGVVVALTLLGFTFQWRYDEIPIPGERFYAYQTASSKLLIRTNRFTSRSQVFSQKYGWIDTGGTNDPELDRLVADILAKH